jgi:hypothetical protein
VKKPNSPPAGNGWSGFVRGIKRLLLTIAIGLFWLLTEAGFHAFNAGERWETRLRDLRRGLK